MTVLYLNLPSSSKSLDAFVPAGVASHDVFPMMALQKAPHEAKALILTNTAAVTFRFT